MLSAEREGARHERQLEAESSARSELAQTLAQSEHSAREMGTLLTQQRTVMPGLCDVLSSGHRSDDAGCREEVRWRFPLPWSAKRVVEP